MNDLAFIWIWQVGRWLFVPISKWDDFLLGSQVTAACLIVVAAFVCLCLIVQRRPDRNRPRVTESYRGNHLHLGSTGTHATRSFVVNGTDWPDPQLPKKGDEHPVPSLHYLRVSRMLDPVQVRPGLWEVTFVYEPA